MDYRWEFEVFNSVEERDTIKSLFIEEMEKFLNSVDSYDDSEYCVVLGGFYPNPLFKIEKISNDNAFCSVPLKVFKYKNTEILYENCFTNWDIKLGVYSYFKYHISGVSPFSRI